MSAELLSIGQSFPRSIRDGREKAEERRQARSRWRTTSPCGTPAASPPWTKRHGNRDSENKPAVSAPLPAERQPTTSPWPRRRPDASAPLLQVKHGLLFHLVGSSSPTSGASPAYTSVLARTVRASVVSRPGYDEGDGSDDRCPARHPGASPPPEHSCGRVCRRTRHHD